MNEILSYSDGHWQVEVGGRVLELLADDPRDPLAAAIDAIAIAEVCALAVRLPTDPYFDPCYWPLPLTVIQ